MQELFNAGWGTFSTTPIISRKGSLLRTCAIRAAKALDLSKTTMHMPVCINDVCVCVFLSMSFMYYLKSVWCLLLIGYLFTLFGFNWPIRNIDHSKLL